MIFAVIGIFAAVGCVVYLQLYNFLDKYGAWMAFGTIVIIDAVWLIILLFFIAIGKYGSPPAGTDENEDQEGLDLRGPDAGQGGYEDIPQDLDFDRKEDRKFLDADEEYEQGSRRGSIHAKIVKKKQPDDFNQKLLDDMDEDIEYDFDGAHYERGSIYQSKKDHTELDTANNDYDGPNTGIQGRDTRQRTQSYAQNIDNSLPANNLMIRATNKEGLDANYDIENDIRKTAAKRKNKKKKRSLSADGGKDRKSVV